MSLKLGQGECHVNHTVKNLNPQDDHLMYTVQLPLNK